MSNKYQDSAAQESEAPGLSTGSKVLLIFLGVFGVLCVACCGGVLWFANQMEMRESSDAAEVAKLREDIIDIDIPERFEPQQLMEFDAVFFRFDMAFYQSANGTDSMMGFAKVQSGYRFFSKENIAEELKNSESKSHLENATSETKTYEVDGKEIAVTFSHGTVEDGENVPADQVGKKWYSATSMIPADDRLIMIIMAGPENEFDEEEIERTIRSIRFPEGE